MNKHFSPSLLLGGLLLALNGTASAEDLYRVAIDFDPPKIFSGLIHQKMVLKGLMSNVQSLCSISPKARGRYVKLDGGDEIPFDCESILAKKPSKLEPSKQETTNKNYTGYSQDDKGVWSVGQTWGTPEQARGFMERGCMSHRTATVAVKTVDPTGNETLRNCAEWRAANPKK